MASTNGPNIFTAQNNAAREAKEKKAQDAKDAVLRKKLQEEEARLLFLREEARVQKEQDIASSVKARLAETNRQTEEFYREKDRKDKAEQRRQQELQVLQAIQTKSQEEGQRIAAQQREEDLRLREEAIKADREKQKKSSEQRRREDKLQEEQEAEKRSTEIESIRIIQKELTKARADGFVYLNSKDAWLLTAEERDGLLDKIKAFYAVPAKKREAELPVKEMPVRVEPIREQEVTRASQPIKNFKISESKTAVKSVPKDILLHTPTQRAVATGILSDIVNQLTDRATQKQTLQEYHTFLVQKIAQIGLEDFAAKIDDPTRPLGVDIKGSIQPLADILKVQPGNSSALLILGILNFSGNPSINTYIKSMRAIPPTYDAWFGSLLGIRLYFDFVQWEVARRVQYTVPWTLDIEKNAAVGLKNVAKMNVDQLERQREVAETKVLELIESFQTPELNGFFDNTPSAFMPHDIPVTASKTIMAKFDNIANAYQSLFLQVSERLKSHDKKLDDDRAKIPHQSGSATVLASVTALDSIIIQTRAEVAETQIAITRASEELKQCQERAMGARAAFVSKQANLLTLP